MAAKLEVNLASLIATCEELTNGDDHWRLTRYIKNLDIMLSELSD
jgi:sulfur relay (sulfurtransferase) DsrC/TusE family protein